LVGWLVDFLGFSNSVRHPRHVVLQPTVNNEMVYILEADAVQSGTCKP
jgi:hypothetical protein